MKLQSFTTFLTASFACAAPHLTTYTTSLLCSTAWSADPITKKTHFPGKCVSLNGYNDCPRAALVPGICPRDNDGAKQACCAEIKCGEKSEGVCLRNDQACVGGEWYRDPHCLTGGAFSCCVPATPRPSPPDPYGQYLNLESDYFIHQASNPEPNSKKETAVGSDDDFLTPKSLEIPGKGLGFPSQTPQDSSASPSDNVEITGDCPFWTNSLGWC